MGLVRNIFANTDKKCLYKFFVNMGIKGSFSFARFQKRQKKGDFFPAFHFISVTDDCNLNCQGCWAIGKEKNHRMEPQKLDKIVVETKNAGSYFFGILGGEPLLYKPLFDLFRKHQDCYFQMFTNGTLLTKKVAEELRSCGNVTPLISFEGDETVADIRRGGKQVYQSAMAAIENSISAGLITGVSISVCKSNFDMALSDEFITSLARKGVVYLWYYIYRPVGKQPEYELCLSAGEIQKLRQHLVEAREKFPILIIDTYWDADGKPFCPAASGLSHHINAAGDVEPCPIIQYSKENAGDLKLEDLYRSSHFLSDFRDEVNAITDGCIVMDDPQWLAEFVRKNKAKNTSGRVDETDRLLSAPKVPGHNSCNNIPDKNWLYRFAKKRAFFGLGAYG